MSTVTATHSARKSLAPLPANLRDFCHGSLDYCPEWITRQHLLRQTRLAKRLSALTGLKVRFSPSSWISDDDRDAIGHLFDVWGLETPTNDGESTIDDRNGDVTEELRRLLLDYARELTELAAKVADSVVRVEITAKGIAVLGRGAE